MFEGTGHLGKVYRGKPENLFLLNYVSVFRYDCEENNDTCKMTGSYHIIATTHLFTAV
jgi:hypothetical protein